MGEEDWHRLAHDRLVTGLIMTTKKWHVGVFGGRKKLRKGLVVAFESLGIKSAEPLRRYAFGKMIEMQRPRDLSTKPDARFVVTKLMDHHIYFPT